MSDESSRVSNSCFQSDIRLQIMAMNKVRNKKRGRKSELSICVQEYALVDEESQDNQGFDDEIALLPRPVIPESELPMTYWSVLKLVKYIRVTCQVTQISGNCD